ncbi:S-layer homology domain-containing protein [Oscillatoria sp. FACHB-1406]|uniref:S-layer homology domain-containing protein n=1 Tax=Oscillatoria sp. FACHB-1406 TaxID=2692846 RepID=UPI001686DACE|nr:S-layer homology domain-containing protein [Oscillatoria sp. FACHB-1406]MBD2576927.1 S-layer homology domain-containing protein [Oscillatoria sp. FACHB-1406]
MIDNLHRSLPPIALISATLCLVCASPSPAAAGFPDVPADYWASPFIEVLNQQGIVTGYLDGTYRPQKALNRDEFAAIIRQAFNREPIRNIESGSSFQDVPKGYWAAAPIEEAYQTGFMKSLANNTFKPKTEITKSEALVALAEGLNLTYANTAAAPPGVPAPIAAPPAAVVPQKRRRVAKNNLAFPLAMTALMQSFIRPAVAAVPPRPVPQATPKAAVLNAAPRPPVTAREYLEKHYEDADKVPAEAVNAVAAVTQAGISVNHPDVRRLEPAGILDRGTAAALIHQALVSKSKLPPLDANNPAKQYVVKTP